MQREPEFRERLTKRGLAPAALDADVAVIDDYIAWCGNDEANCTSANMKRYCRERIAGQDDAWQRVIALARYYAFHGRTDELTYLITLTGTRGVLESQSTRLKNLAGEATEQAVCRPLPPAGTLQEDYPSHIVAYLKRLRTALPEATCRRVLAGNHHGLPDEAFTEQVEFYTETHDIDALLRRRHQNMLKEMRECYEQGRLWYEQRITPEVLAYVEEHQEIQAGVREGNRIFITKIPYQPDAWLQETDPTKSAIWPVTAPLCGQVCSTAHKYPRCGAIARGDSRSCPSTLSLVRSWR